MKFFSAEQDFPGEVVMGFILPIEFIDNCIHHYHEEAV